MAPNPRKLTHAKAKELFRLATNPNGRGNKRKATRLADEIGEKELYRNHFNEAQIHGLSVLNHAAKRGHLLLAQLLMSRLAVDPTSTQYDQCNRTTLHYAMHSGELDLVTELLGTYFCDPNAMDLYGSTPLQVAIASDHSAIALKMIASKANVEIENHFGRAIHAAAFGGNLSVVTAIAERYPDEVNAMVSGLISPLMCAMYGSEPACENFLIGICSLDGMALLYKVVCLKDTEAEALAAVGNLIERGADPNIFEEFLYEDLAIICAAKKGWDGVVDSLLAKTNRIPGVANWSAPGLIEHVKSPAFKMMDVEKTNNRVKNLKSRVLGELRAFHNLTATAMCMSLKNEMDSVEWGHYLSLCRFLSFMWFQGQSVTCAEQSILGMVHILACSEEPGMDNWAVVGVEGCLALSPDNPEYLTLYESLKRN